MLTAYGRDKSGATAIEYGLIAALIAVALIGAMTQWAKVQNEQYEKLSTALEK
ncbi:MAG: Flp family type IVb pilin [Robiginitomaculum sp.]|nr:MAG: Flp family type IVb pilin [Robiginitomaculum sp.]